MPRWETPRLTDGEHGLEAFEPFAPARAVSGAEHQRSEMRTAHSSLQGFNPQQPQRPSTPRAPRSGRCCSVRTILAKVRTKSKGFSKNVVS